MSAVALQSFGFGEQLVRVVDREGGIWFVANDVCRALEINNSRQAVSRLEDDEKGVIISDTLGGQQEVTIISESGLYALIFRSRKPVAVTFRKWVTAEVLPAIRRTGRFDLAANEDGVQPPTPEEADRADAWRAGLLLVREARIVGGRAAARRAWALAGLPDVFSGERALPGFVIKDIHRSVTDWMEERCEHVPGHRVPSQDLYADYLDWCVETGTRAQSLTGFGRILSGCGIVTMKIDRMHRVGLRLKD